MQASPLRLHTMARVPSTGKKTAIEPPAAVWTDPATAAAAAGEGTAALDKAIDVLMAVVDAEDGLGQAALSERLALPRTTVYRLLATLVARGLLRRDPSRKVYTLGARCFDMGRKARATPDLVAAAAIELRALRDLTGETTYLAALDGQEVVSLERYDGAHGQRSAAALGQRKPLHCTSQGKAILGALPAEARDALVRELRLEALTPRTLTDRRRLQAELRITAARGWAMDDEEIVLGVRCVGAPVVDAEGRVHGAISVAGPAWRITRQRAELLGPEVAEAARRIGGQMRQAATSAADPAITAVDAPWAFWGACPRLHAGGALYWADRLAPALRVLGVDGRERVLLEAEAPVTGLAFLGDDLVLTHEAGATRVTPDGRHAPLTAWPAGVLQALCNGPDGRLWAALPTPQGGSRIGEIAPGGAFRGAWQVDEPVQALAWSADGQQLHLAAPASGSLLVVRTQGTAVRRLATLPPGAGRISGLALDDQGGTWTALAEGWSVVRVASDGQLDRVVGLPVPCPTDLAFDAAGRRLWVTTARQTVPLDALEKAPWSGRLLSVGL